MKSAMPASPAERVEKLRSIPLFADLSDESLHRVLDRATEFDAPAGQVLVQVNQPASGLFVIEEGNVAVEMRDKSVALGPGEFFGEMALLDRDAVRSARVRTKTPVRCLAINRDDFAAMLETEPKMAICMLQVLARRLAAETRSVSH